MVTLLQWFVISNSFWKLKTNVFERERTICQGEYVTVSCEPGYIFITGVFYGRDSSYSCRWTRRNSGRCKSTAADEVVNQLCDRQQVCYLSVNRNSFNDRKCTYDNPYVRIRYSCHREQSTQTEITSQMSFNVTTETLVSDAFPSVSVKLSDFIGTERSRQEKSRVAILRTFEIILISIGSALGLATFFTVLSYLCHRQLRHSNQTQNDEKHDEFWIPLQFDTIAAAIHRSATGSKLISISMSEEEVTSMLRRSHSEPNIGHSKPGEEISNSVDDSCDDNERMKTDSNDCYSNYINV